MANGFLHCSASAACESAPRPSFVVPQPATFQRRYRIPIQTESRKALHCRLSGACVRLRRRPNAPLKTTCPALLQSTPFLNLLLGVLSARIIGKISRWHCVFGLFYIRSQHQ